MWLVMPINYRYSTLDSLQGTWLSSKDTSYKIQIIGHIKYEFYANQCTDTLNFFLDTNCTDTAIANYNMTKTDGNHLIVYANGYPSYEFCYEIGYLSDNSLELYYDGKHISFSKQ